VATTSESQEGPGAAGGTTPAERDALLEQIWRDLSRSRRNAFAFYRAPVPASYACPLAPEPEASSSTAQPVPRTKGRHALLERLRDINTDYALSLVAEDDPSATRPIIRTEAPSAEASAAAGPTGAPSVALRRQLSVDPAYESATSSPPIFLEPPSPQGRRGSNSGLSDASEGEVDFASADEGDSEGHRRALDQAAALLSGQRTALPAPLPIVDRQWHSLLRILFVYATLHPSTGYVQGMGETAFVLLYVLGTAGRAPQASSSSRDEPASAYRDHELDPPACHAEADAFWLFSNLLGQVRELYEFEGLDYDAAGLRVRNGLEQAMPVRPRTDLGGMATALLRTSLRLRWLDEELWRALVSPARAHAKITSSLTSRIQSVSGLDPRLPYYSFRWLACLLSTELALPSMVQIWDALLAESSEPSEVSASPKIDFMIDLCCALLVSQRARLLAALLAPPENSDAFAEGMKVLQNFEEIEVAPVLEQANLFRQRRMAAPLTGDGPPETHQEAEARSSTNTVRQRAADTLRGWTQAASGPSAPKWLASARTSMRSVSAPLASAPAALSSLPPPPSAIDEEGSEPALSPLRNTRSALTRYAEAFQSSDAAATLSKASTNWTAKAMATWSASPRSRDASPATETPPASARSLAGLGSSFFRARSVSNSTAASASSPVLGPSSTIHPALRWSREMPHLPVPNVLDSPAGREDYTWTGSLGRNFSPSSPSLHGVDSPADSPSLAPSSRFQNLPSLASSPSAQARGASRNAGPKPLLLTRSARPPREGSSPGEHLSEPSSRKVSSGPMASASPRGAADRAARMARRDSAYSSSVASGYSSRPTSDAGDDYASRLAEPDDPLDSLPPLPSLLAGRSVPMPAGMPSSAPPLGYQGSGNGTAPASAFARLRAVNGADHAPQALPSRMSDTGSVSSDGRPRSERADSRAEAVMPAQLAFGDASSSADAPLVAASTLMRPRATRRRESNSSQAGSGSVTIASTATFADGSTEDEAESSMRSTQRLSSRSSVTSASSRRRSSGRGADADGPRPLSLHSTGEEVPSLRRKYTLEDAPVPASVSEEPEVLSPEWSDSMPLPSPTYAPGDAPPPSRSSIVRSKRAYSGVKSRRQSSETTNANGATRTTSRSSLRSRRRSSGGLLGASMAANGALASDFDAYHPPPSPGVHAGETVSAAELFDALAVSQPTTPGEDAAAKPASNARSSKDALSLRNMPAHHMATDASDEETFGAPQLHAYPQDGTQTPGAAMEAIGSALFRGTLED
jgi:hypothetical protein